MTLGALNRAQAVPPSRRASCSALVLVMMAQTDLSPPTSITISLFTAPRSTRLIVPTSLLRALLADHQADSRGPLYPPIVNTPVLVDKTRAELYIEGDEYVYTPN